MIQLAPWWNWWIPQFLLSSIVLAFGARSMGSLFVKEKTSPRLEFVLGFGVLSALVSFLVPLKGFAIIPVLALIFWKRQELKWDEFDFVIFLILAAAVFFQPYATDANTTEIQFQAFSQWWPVDGLVRQDTHFGFSLILFSFWPYVSLSNIVSTQGPILGIVAWQTLLFCLESMNVPLSRRNKLFALTLFLGSLFFRKQLHMKASPIGFLFVLVFFALLQDRKELKNKPYILGALGALSLYFGEYGFIILSLVLALLMVFSNWQRHILMLSGWVGVFAIPEVLRKSLILFQLPVAIGLTVFVGFLSFGLTKIKSETEFKLRDRSLTLFSVAALGAALFLSSLVDPRASEISNMTFYTWLVTKEGMLGILAVVFFFVSRKSAPAFYMLILSQIIIFITWRLIFIKNIFPEGSPSFFLFWNVFKNSNMIALPLLVSISAVLCFHNRARLKWLVAAFCIFFQDPFVKSVGDGPFAPHAPRFSVLRTMDSIYFRSITTKAKSSGSGHLVLPPFGVDDVESVEQIYALQKSIAPKRIRLCTSQVQRYAGDWELPTYSFSHTAGVLVENITGEPKECTHTVIKDGSRISINENR